MALDSTRSASPGGAMRYLGDWEGCMRDDLSSRCRKSWDGHGCNSRMGIGPVAGRSYSVLGFGRVAAGCRAASRLNGQLQERSSVSVGEGGADTDSKSRIGCRTSVVVPQ